MTESNETSSEATTAETPETPAQEIDWKAEARKWEKHSKANKAELDKLTATLTEKSTELQRLNDRLKGADTALEEERTKLGTVATEAVRYKVAFNHGLTQEDLDALPEGLDEEALTKIASRLSASSTRKPAPNPSQGLGKSAPLDKAHAFQQALFGNNE
jgi:hypothetical protein